MPPSVQGSSMSVEIKVDLGSLKQYTKNLVNIDKALGPAVILGQGLIVKEWTKARGGNRRAMRKLSPKYRKWKGEKTGRFRRDLNLSGDLYRSFIDVKKKKNIFFMTFKSSAGKKAEANYRRDRNMMKVGDMIRKRMTKRVRDGLWKGVA